MNRSFASIALAVLSAVSACTAIVDFDRSLIPHPTDDAGRGGTEPRPGDRDSSVPGNTGGRTSGGGAGGRASGGRPSAGGRIVDAQSEVTSRADADADAEPPEPCDLTTHERCGLDELCCESAGVRVCRKTSVTECTACGAGCTQGLAAGCDGRTCECAPSSGKECSGTGAESYCVQGSGGASCDECRTASDCLGKPVGQRECVDGACVQCSPVANNAGCSGTTPICDTATKTCRACSPVANECAGTSVCTQSGACGGCAHSNTDCLASTSPICDSGTTQCRACSGNAECQAELGKPYCVDTQRCSSCLPTTEAGCTDAAKPDCRLSASSDYECLPCESDDHCANKGNSKACDAASGKCVECTADSDCTDPAKPLCDGQACVACNAVTSGTSADARCEQKSASTKACATSGSQKGRCAICDPGDSAGCASSQLCCENFGSMACEGTSAATGCAACDMPCDPNIANACGNRSCRCGSGPACSGTGTSRFCLGNPGACVECRTDADCGDPAAPLCEGNQCVPCDQAGASSANARCAQKRGGTGACATSLASKGQCTACDPTDHQGCPVGQICCSSAGAPQCQLTGASSQCTACGVPCDANIANACNASHQCGCGIGPACTGTGTSRFCAGTPRSCVECRNDGDCSDPTKPFCQGGSCVGCASDAQCALESAGALPLCGATGACGPDSDCANTADCTDGRHGQCVDVDPDAGVPTKKCRICDPLTNNGCVAGEACSATFVCVPL